MKTLNLTIKAITVFLLAGALFFSCSLADTDPDAYGTLVITLPGSDSARTLSETDTFSEDFLADLRYIVDCSGPGNESREFGPNGKVAIPLSPGDWNVTVTVKNAAEIIGRSVPKSVTIEAGKTTSPVAIEIDITANRKNAISTFTLKMGSTSFHGAINNDTIVVTVPPGTNISSMGFDVEHNGYKISHEPNDAALNFAEKSYTFSVQPEYGKTRAYTVSVVEDVVEPPEPPEIEWKEVRWGKYGLGDLDKPDNAKVIYVTYEKSDANNKNGKLQQTYGLREFRNTEFPDFFAVVFIDEDKSIYSQLYSQIEALPSYTTDSRETNPEYEITRQFTKDSYVRRVVLYKSTDQKYKNYTIITVRQGEDWLQ